MKIYIEKKSGPLMGDVRKNDLPFHLERDKWEFVDSIEQADVIPIVKAPIVGNYNHINISLDEQLNVIRNYKDKIFLLMFHNHITETMGEKVIQLYLSDYAEFDNVYAVSVNLISCPRQISYNYYFNWVKAHFTEYSKHDLRFDRLWVANCSEKSFTLPNIKPFDASKKFCIPNFIRTKGTPEFLEFKNRARLVLSEHTNSSDSYYSDFRKNIQLMPEESELWPSAYKGTEHGMSGVGIIPIANTYFTDSIVSVFVESVASFLKVTGNVLAFTEKTYIPLVKGHFILPFGSPGIVEELKKQGFMFPEWIDYSYDLIHNDEHRLKSFINSFLKLKNISLEQMNRLANQDIEIRKHNRRVIVRSNYDFLYDKVKNLG
jgi:hypothetical protein